MWLLTPPEERFFDSSERAAVDRVFAAIIPGGPSAPSASEVGAVEFVDRLLAMGPETYYEIPAWRDLYRRGLAALADAAGEMFSGRAIKDLSKDEVTQLLRGLSGATLAGFDAGIDQKRLFSTLRNHCIEGCFCDPRWGGNREGVMWRWFGYLEKPQQLRRTAGDG